MARGKKAAKALTPEERLEQALVPVEEQPYPIPENWCWVTIGAIASVKGGKRIPKGNKLVEYKTDHPYIRVTDFDNRSIATEQVKYIDEETFKLIRNYTISTQDVYISIAGTIGKVGIIPDDLDGANLTENAAKITNIRGVEKNFLLWLLESEVAQSQTRDATISTTQPKLALFRIENVKFPLSPLTEQQRIVSRIESLFAKLDEAKEKAQAVVDGFELRKSAILHKAFTGELTEKWRKEHGVGLDSWTQLSIASICHSLKYGTAKKSEKTGSVVVLRMGNLQQGEIDWSDLAYSSDKDDIEKYRLEAGDVLFNRTNSAALVGKTSIYRGEYPAIYAGYLIKLDYDHGIVVGDFLNYALNTDRAKEYCNSVKTDGVNQSNINAKKIGAYVIAVPKMDEQKEIVKLLQKLLASEQQAKESAESVLSQIDTMKKAILARAFRGELGTNDPAEEWAGELLKENLPE